MTTYPKDLALFYRVHVFFCTQKRPEDNPHGSCAAKGSEADRKYLKTRVKELGLANVRINSAGCLGRCDQGPTLVVYPEGVWYAYRDRNDIEEILTSHLRDGNLVPRLMLGRA